MPWCTDSLTSVNIFWLRWRRVTSCVAQRDLAAISEQVETITKEAERLIGLFPDAQEHIAAKHEEMVQAWNGLVEKATHRKEKLHQAEQLQMYFNDYRELTWVVIVSFLCFGWFVFRADWHYQSLTMVNIFMTITWCKLEHVHDNHLMQIKTCLWQSPDSN